MKWPFIPWNLSFNAIDLLLRRNVPLSKRLLLTPHLGLKEAFGSQHLELSYAYETERVKE